MNGVKVSDRGSTTTVSAEQPKRKALDANRYATKKTIAQGLLDVALLTANASQLKYVLQVGYDKHPFYYLMLSLIIISMILQIVVAVLSLSLNMMRDCLLDREEYAYSATFLSYFSLSAVTAISFLNIIISAFEPFSLVY